MKQGRRFLASVCAFALAANGLVCVNAQEKKNDYRADANNVLIGGSLTETITITATEPNGLVKGIGLGEANIFQFYAHEMSFDNRLISDAPFSAAVVSETIQTLGDGTRIAQRSEGRIYRDSQGRTRNERAFSISETGEPKQVVTIYDPIGGLSYTLDPENRIARKMEYFRKAEPAPSVSTGAAANGTTPPKATASNHLSPGSPIKRVQPPYPVMAKAARVSDVVQVAILIGETGEVLNPVVVSGHPLLRDAALNAAREWVFKPTELAGRAVKVRCLLQFTFKLVQEDPASTQTAGKNSKYTVQTESLGKQMIEGVECEGERKVTTLLTGVIGNDRPIETVIETWYAKELRMMILSKRSDPRFGESSYRVSHLARAEPNAALFQAPSDYTVQEPPTPLKKRRQEEQK